MLPDRKRFESGSHAQEVTLSRWLWNLPGGCGEGGEKEQGACGSGVGEGAADV